MSPVTRLSVAALFAYTSYAMCRVPILPLYAQSLGAGPAEIGVLMAMSTLTGVALKAPAGALSDAIGRGAVLLGAGLVFAVLPFAYVFAGSLAMLMAIRTVHGSATALFGPVAAATISDLAPPERRGHALGLYSAVQGAGQAAGAAAAGSLAQVSPAIVFLTSGAIGSIGLAFVTRGAWPGARHHGASAPRRVIGSISDAVRDPVILRVSSVQAGLLAISGATGAFLPLHAHDTLALSSRAIGLVIAAQVAATLATRPLAGRLSDRAGRPRVIQVGLLTVAIGIALVGAAPRLPALIVASVLFGAGVALAGAAASALVTDRSRRSGYGAAHGVFGTIYDVGDAAGPIVAGLMVAAVGYRVFFLSAALWALVLFVVCRASGWGSAATNPT